MKFFWFIILSIFSVNIFAQQTDSLKNSLQKEVKPITEEFKKKLTASLLIVGGYGVSLTDSVGFNELHSMKDSVVDNTFYLRYARVSAKYQLTPKFEAGVLVNLADFKSNPLNRVLENAYVGYKLNDYLNFRFGQFRPFFGIEDVHAFEQHKSYYWSNQYNLFGKSNWMSFQLGAAVYGSLKKINIPLNYYFTVYNGNGKNKDFDNDNYKDWATRLEYILSKNISLGANFATTFVNKKNVGAFTADLKTLHHLSKKWELETESSYAYGHNTFDYFASKATPDQMHNYKMSGLYILPIARYKIDNAYLRGAEFSCRWENLIDNLDIKRNPQTTWTPMFSLLFADNYAAKFSLVGIIDKYKTNVPGTTKYSQNRLLAQFQFRF